MNNQMTDPRDQKFSVAHLRENIDHHAKKGFAVVLVFSTMKMLLQISSTVILARLISPEDYGIVAVVLPVVMIAIGLSEFGLGDALVQRPHVNHRTASALFWINFLLGTVLAIILVICAKPASVFFDQSRVTWVMIALAPSVFFSALLAQFVGILRRQMRIRVLETILMGSTFISLAIAITLALAGATYWAIVAQAVSQSAVSLFVVAMACKWLPSPPSREMFTEARSFMKFGGLLAISRLVDQLAQGFGTIMTGRLFGASDAALFHRAWSLAILPSHRMVSPLASAFLPAFSRATTDVVGFATLFERTAGQIALVTMPISIALCSAPELVIRVMLGPNWSQAAPILGYLGLMTLQSTAIYPLIWAITACGDARAIFNYRIFASFVSIVAIICGARSGALEVAAYYIFSGFVIQLPVLIMTCMRTTKLSAHTMLRAFFGPLFLALAWVALIDGFRNTFSYSSILVELSFVAGGCIIAVILHIFTNNALRRDAVRISSWFIRFSRGGPYR